MGCAGGCSKLILILLNVVVLLLGLGLSAVGVLGLIGGNLLKTAITPVIAALPEIRDAFKFADGPGGTPSVDEAAESIMTLLRDIAVPVLAIGIILTIITFCGMCGACCNNKCLLSIYITCLVIITLALVIMLPLYATGMLDNLMKDLLTTSVKQNYESVDTFTALNLAWTVLMIELECCGVESYLDFYTDSVWQRNRTITGSSGNVVVTLEAPYACCKMDDDWTPLEPTLCAIQPNITTSNYETGCFDEMNSWLETYDLYVIGGIAGVIVFLVLLIVFAIVIIKDKGTSKVV